MVPQDFADITGPDTLEGPEEAGLEEEEVPEDACEAGFLSPACMNTMVQVHLSLCLGYSQSLWYQGNPPANNSKHHIKALVTSYQMTAPVMARFYHLLGGCCHWTSDGSKPGAIPVCESQAENVLLPFRIPYGELLI